MTDTDIPLGKRIAANARDFTRLAREEQAFMKARAHSRRVRFFRNLLPFIALIIVVAFSWVTFFASPPAADIVSLNSADGESDRLVMTQPKVEGYTSANRPYLFSAARAIQDPARTGMIELEAIDAIMPLGRYGQAHIVAQGGHIDNVNGRMLLDKPFAIKTSDGIDVRFLSADINIASSQLISNERVEINRQGEILTSGSLHILDEGQLFVFGGGVRLLIAKAQALE